VLKAKIPADDPRSIDRIRAHYDVERRLAQRLRDADRPARRTLYTALYDDLYRLLPDHPAFRIAARPDVRKAYVAKLVRWLEPYLGRDRTFLEIGPGDCLLSIAVAERSRWVHAVDVSDGIASTVRPPNFTLHIGDGVNLPLPDAAVDLAFSDQLMEHLHPDDALDQLRDIHRVLAPGGTYVCITPNKLSGPHDVSRFFSDESEGFHIREYTAGELAALMRQIGFADVRVALPVRGRLRAFPLAPFVWLERALQLLPERARRPLARSRVLGALLGIRLFARK
jgi:SAM-dependent methyltransferase